MAQIIQDVWLPSCGLFQTEHTIQVLGLPHAPSSDPEQLIHDSFGHFRCLPFLQDKLFMFFGSLRCHPLNRSNSSRLVWRLRLPLFWTEAILRAVWRLRGHLLLAEAILRVFWRLRRHLIFDRSNSSCCLVTQAASASDRTNSSVAIQAPSVVVCFVSTNSWGYFGDSGAICF